MRERRDAACGTDDGRHLADRRTAAGYECRAALRDEAVERVAAIRRVSGRDERIGDVRPSDGAAAAGRHAAQQPFTVERHAELRQPRDHRLDAAAPVFALSIEEDDEGRVIGIDEVAEDVDVTPAFDRGDLDPGDESHTVLRGGSGRLGQAGGGVVVGEADDREPEAGGPRHQRLRRQSAVGRGRMEVEIDHEVRSWRGRGASPCASGRPCADARRAIGTRESAGRDAAVPRRRTRGRSSCPPSPRSARRSA